MKQFFFLLPFFFINRSLATHLVTDDKSVSDYQDFNNDSLSVSSDENSFFSPGEVHTDFDKEEIDKDEQESLSLPEERQPIASSSESIWNQVALIFFAMMLLLSAVLFIYYLVKKKKIKTPKVQNVKLTPSPPPFEKKTKQGY